MKDGKDIAVDLYRRMFTIRAFEERAIALYKDGLLGGSYHSYVGQEAVATGVCAALRAADPITTTYRGRGTHLAKGADPTRLFAELLGRREGFCKGKGGPMHVAHMDTGILSTNGIVGAGAPTAAGAALTAQMASDDRVAATFFGDGAINQGALMETLNLAALWRLPLLLVCENNMYAEMTPLQESVKNPALFERAEAFGIASQAVDGNDVGAVRQAAGEAVDRARRGEGPTFLEAKTYRLHGHMQGDKENYRTKEEVASWHEQDPLKRWKSHMLAERWMSKEDLATLEDQVNTTLDRCRDAALDAPEPEAVEIDMDVY